MQIREGGAVEVDEIVAVTMGPSTADARAAQGRVARRRPLGAPVRRRRWPAPTWPRPATRCPRRCEKESPDLVLLGQQSDDGECYTIGAVVADHLRMPSLTQVIKMDVDAARRCAASARPSTATTPSQVELPAVISVGDAINEPRYPSLKAIMGAKKKPLETVGAGDVGIDASLVGGEGSRVQCGEFKDPPAKAAGTDHRGRGHRRHRREDRRLARRKEADLDMADVLTYVLHYEGAFNKNSLGAVSEGAARAAEVGGECHAVVVGGDDLTDELCQIAGRRTARRRCYRAKGPEGLAQPVDRRDGQGDRRAAATATRCSAAACSASRSAPGWPRASRPA